MALIPGVLSQRTYPGAGDLDDCWCVATVWAAVASRPSIRRPTVPEFRRHADKPDAPGATGGNIRNVYAGARGSWPQLGTRIYMGATFEPLLASIRSGQPASIALNAAYLPAALQYGFRGLHQVGVAWDGSRLRLANPLAPQGSRPPVISVAHLKTAMRTLLGSAAPLPYRAVLFPEPLTGPRWDLAVPADIRSAYSASAVASKLRALGIKTYGTVINLSDLEAGLRKRGIDFGTSVQLIDARALMKSGTGR